MPSESDKIPWRTLIGPVIGFVTITVLLTVGIQVIGLDRIQTIIEQAGPVAPLIYILVRASTFVAAPLNSGPLQFAAGILFGPLLGTLYSVLGELIGGSLNFAIARRFGRPIVTRLVGENGMARVDQFVHQVGETWTLIYARLFLFALYDFVSYAAGFTPIRYRRYALITVIGGIIPTFAAVTIGSRLNGDMGQLVILYAALGVLCIIPLVFYRRIRRWFDRRLRPMNQDSH